jgi:hypothetical protein
LIRSVKPSEIALCAARLSEAVGEPCAPWLVPAFMAKQMAGTMIEGDDGRGQLAIFWHKTHDLHLFINAGISLDNRVKMTDTMFREFERLARLNGCTMVELATRRKGLVRESCKRGYVIDSQVLRKVL